MLKAIIEGFGAKAAPTEGSPRAVENSGAIANVTDAQLMQLAARAGPALPIRRGKDVGLPRNAPVFDLDELRKRNLNLVVSQALRNKVIGRK